MNNNTTPLIYIPIKNTLEIHSEIKEKLDYFLSIQKIPNIIFHGPSGSGKKSLLTYFIEKIYQYDKNKMKQYTMYVNCAFGKGIKFIREELKFFAKTNIQENIFKSIVLLNADKLTIDAQSALRRCIELFNHNTRFFIVIEDKYKLLKPILSRFCEIYVPQPIIDNDEVNLHQYHLSSGTNGNGNNDKNNSLESLKKQLKILSIKNKNNELKSKDLIDISTQLYEKGYSGLDILTLLENHKFMENEISLEKRYELLICFNKVVKEIRNEKIILFFLLNFIFLSLNCSLENIFFM
jgi:DNA polymerase III delta prime subunit